MTTTKMTIDVSDWKCRRCAQTSIDTRNTHPFAVPCQGSAYRVSLVSDTEVPTPEGWTTLGDITPGQEVFDEQGRICIVAEVSGESVEPVSEVKFGDGSSLVAGNDHPWMILSPADFFPANLRIYRPGPWNAGCWPMTTLELMFSFNEATERRTRPRHYIPVAAPPEIGRQGTSSPPLDTRAMAGRRRLRQCHHLLRSGRRNPLPGECWRNRRTLARSKPRGASSPMQPRSGTRTPLVDPSEGTGLGKQQAHAASLPAGGPGATAGVAPGPDRLRRPCLCRWGGGIYLEVHPAR